MLSAALLVAGAICALPFLLPVHEFPLPSFQPEWLAGALGTAAVSLACAGLARRPRGLIPLPWMTNFLVVFAVFTAAQGILLPAAYPSIPWLAATYIVFAAALVWLGAQLRAHFGLERLVTLLANCVLIAAVLSSAFAVIQYFGRPRWLEDLVSGLASGRAYGNIAQANLFANYLAVGEASLVFLWARRSIGSPAAIWAAVLLAGAGTLSGSRSTILFAIWFAVVAGWFATKRSNSEYKRMAIASAGMALGVVCASITALGIESLAAAPGAHSAARVLEGAALYSDPRWPAWTLAWRIFADTPWLGSGWASYPGAAFAAGILPEMTRIGEVWTSSHNIFLELLSGSGLFGTSIIVSGVTGWAWGAWRTRPQGGEVAMGWVAAVVGIEFLHSQVEFPLWSAHFLALTALAIGAGSAPPAQQSKMPRMLLTSLAAGCIALALVLTLTLRDHVRLDTTYITGSSVTLSPSEDARRDAGTMYDLRKGFLGPIAEVRLLRGLPLDRIPGRDALDMSSRVMRFWPSHDLAVRRAIFLALSGNGSQADQLVKRVLQTFPHRCSATRQLLEQARTARPGAIEPLLNLVRGASDRVCA